MATSLSVTRVIEQELRQIDQQIEQLRDDRTRLVRALDALGAGRANGSQPTATARRAEARRRSTKPRRPASRGRAPRGSNLAAIIDYVRTNPGATTSHIADGTGIAKTVVYSAVARLSNSGRLRREPLADGQVAYHPGDA